MENATKALSIAANVLLALMILTVIMYMYNKIRVHPMEEEHAKLVEQAEEFNKQFEVYDKRLMHGVEVLSAVNKAASNNDKYIIGKWLSGTLSSTEFAIDVQVVLKEELTEKVEVYYNYAPMADNTVPAGTKPQMNKPYTSGQGVSSLTFKDLVDNPGCVWPKFKVPGNEYLKIYELEPSGWDNQIFKLITHNIEIKKTINSEEAAASSREHNYLIYNLLPGGEYSKDAIARDDVFLKSLVNSIKILTTSDSQIVNYRDETLTKGSITYTTTNNIFSATENETAFSSVKWVPAVSDFKNRKFKCVGVDENGKPDGTPGIVYNEKNGAIIKMTFVEYSIN